jgi:hypothetical protein
MVTGIPDAISTPAFADPGGWRLSLRLKKLSLWDFDALVAELEPVDNESVAAYEHLIGLRKRMDEVLVELGKEPIGDWRPHVSLAYFAKRESAARALAFLPEWNHIFREELANCVIEFSAFDLCCFIDMTRFFLAPPRCR